ncbi:glycosyltransferase family 39 protein [Granulicella sp. dw_53]|uniref:glycosyltransferase family 39 protein n=1 Tax=Granulicella sp. dw_53 TaxID=2719792 RepID=UPI001BD50717|nr:glycosyltransferase family 39 protein [Granulicella sp. dw_53]
MTSEESISRPRRRLQSLSIAAALTAGLLLRLWFILHAARIAGDTLIYGDIALNWLDHGIYGFTQTAAPPLPTLIRLPGYPAFLALCFTVFGREHYTAVMIAQAFIDLATCLILAVLAGRLFGRRAFHAALWFGALCPFTASYVAAPLAETLTLTCIAVAFYALHRWQHLYRTQPQAALSNRWLYLLAASLAYAILLRPEQGLLAVAILPAILWTTLRSKPTPSLLHRAAPALLVAVLTLLPLAPWTLRNWHTFHVLQPLAPRYATDPGEIVPLGFQRWYRSWAIEFTSTEDVYWNYDGALVQLSDIPTRAFDNNAQLLATNALLDEYNQTARTNPTLDARFSALASERIHADPLRYYLALPVARLLNMALRPRTEMLPIALEWWKFREHPAQSILAASFGALNLAYFILAGLGLRRWSRLTRNGLRWNGYPTLAKAMIATIALRSALLMTLDNSEPRYTLEFFPIFIVAIAALFTTQRTTEAP